MKYFRQIFPLLVMCLLLSSCAWFDGSEKEESSSEATEEAPFVSLVWVEYTTMHKIILRIVEEEDGYLDTEGSEEEPVLDNGPSEYYETDIDILIEAGILAKDDDGYVIASEEELDQLAEDSEVRSSLLGAAMDALLMANEVRWCGEPERGKDFKDKYLDAHSNLDHQSYETQEQYLESIDDYVDCGTG